MVGQFTEGRRWHDLAVAVDPGSREHAWAVFGAGRAGGAAGRPGRGRAAARPGGRARRRQRRREPGRARQRRPGHRRLQRRRPGDRPGQVRGGARAATSGSASATRSPWSPTPGSPRPASCPARSTARSSCARSACGAATRPASSGPAAPRCGSAARPAGSPATSPPPSPTRCPACGSRSRSTTCTRSRCRSTCSRSAGWRRPSSSSPPSCYGAGEALWTLLNAPVLMGPGYAEIRKSAADTARAALGEERFDELLGRGLAMHLADALAMAKGETPADGFLGGEPGALGGASSSPGARRRSRPWSRPGSATARSPRGCSCPSARSTPTWSTSSPSSASPRGRSWRAGCSGRARPVAGLCPVTVTARGPPFILRHQYSSRTSTATFPPVTGRLPADGKVSACQMMRSPACPGGSCSLQARPG